MATFGSGLVALGVVASALLLDESGEHLVERWLVLLEPRHLDAGLPEHLDDARAGGRRLFRGDHELARRGLAHRQDALQVGQHLGVDGPLRVHLDHLAAEDGLAQLVGRVERDQPAIHDHRDVVAVLGLGDVLRRDEQRASLVAQPAQLVPDGLAQHRIDAGGRLIHEQHIRAVHEGAGELEPALHATGQVAREPMPRVGQLHHLERVSDEGAPLERADAIQCRDEADVLLRREVLVQAEQLRHVGDPAARRAAEPPRILAEDADLAVGAAEGAGQHADGRGLARPARPDDPQDRPGGTSKLSPSTTRRPSKARDTSRATMIGSEEAVTRSQNASRVPPAEQALATDASAARGMRQVSRSCTGAYMADLSTSSATRCARTSSPMSTATAASTFRSTTSRTSAMPSRASTDRLREQGARSDRKKILARRAP